MILGLMCGELLRRPSTPQAKVKTLLIAALLLTTAGLLLGITICPIIKRIWTPSWALCSGGLVIALLAAFYWLIDVRGHRQWSQFLVVVGMNSIAIYLMSQLLRPWMGTCSRRTSVPACSPGPTDRSRAIASPCSSSGSSAGDAPPENFPADLTNHRRFYPSPRLP